MTVTAHHADTCPLCHDSLDSWPNGNHCTVEPRTCYPDDPPDTHRRCSGCGLNIVDMENA